MKFPELQDSIFIKRNNRFTAAIKLPDGSISTAFIPTTGRLTGALNPGCRVWLEPADNPKRKTRYSLVLSELSDGGLCSVNAYMANYLFAEAFQNARLSGFNPEAQLENEVAVGSSRLDFRLSTPDGLCWVEVKSVTYVDNGVGKFPDAPTERGKKHLFELAELVEKGHRARVVFIAQREDARAFTPFTAIDPEFSAALHQVRQAGVEILAYRSCVSLEGIEISNEIPVRLESAD
jgi:sugar fermentation stimulation protein A